MRQDGVQWAEEIGEDSESLFRDKVRKESYAVKRTCELVLENRGQWRASAVKILHMMINII